MPKQPAPLAAAGIAPVKAVARAARVSVLADAFAAMEPGMTYTISGKKIQRIRQIAKAAGWRIETTADPHIAGNRIFSKHKIV